MEDTIINNTAGNVTRNAPNPFMDMMKTAFEKVQNPAHPKEIDVLHLSEKIKAGNAKILDVRTPGEYAQGHLEDSVLLPLQELSYYGPAAETKIPFSKDDEIFIICRSGARSAAAANILSSLGYSNAVNVSGGIISWIQRGLQITN